MSKSTSLKIAALLGAVVILTATALSASPALAARGGGKGNPGGGGSGGTTTSAVVTVSPNPVPAYGWYTWSGSGFYPNQVVYVSGCGGAFNLWADSTGRFYTGNTAGSGGTCTYYFSQKVGTKYVSMYTLIMTVQ